LKIRISIFFILLVLSRIAFAQDIPIDPRQPLGISYCNQSFSIAPNFTMAASLSVSGMKISFSTGYISGEDVLNLSGNFGSVGGVWSAPQGYLILSGSSSINDYIQAIRQVKYINNAPIPTQGERTITFSLNSVFDAVDYLPSTQHYYQFISRKNITWTSANPKQNL